MPAPEGDLQPTPYHDVNALLAALSQGAARVLGDRLSGFYLTGSLAWGGYEPGASDVDVLVAIARPLVARETEALRAFHEQVAVSPLALAGKLDVLYLAPGALLSRERRHAAHPMVDSGRFTLEAHDSNHAFNRHIACERGIVIIGPRPPELIAPVSPEELRNAVRQQLAGPWQRNLEPEQREWMSYRHHQAFAVLTMCRALHTIETGELLSKPEAAEWAVRSAEPRWHQLIQRALPWRFDRSLDDPSDTLAFMRWAMQRVGIDPA